MMRQINDYRKNTGLLNQALSKQYPNRRIGPIGARHCCRIIIRRKRYLEKIYAMMSKKLLQVPTIKKVVNQKKIAIISQTFSQS